MKITGLKVNHKVNPLGYDFPYLHFDWTVEDAEGKDAAWVSLTIDRVQEDGTRVRVYESGKTVPEAGGGLDAELAFSAGTRYEWRVRAASDAGEEAESEPAWFETGKPDVEDVGAGTHAGACCSARQPDATFAGGKKVCVREESSSAEGSDEGTVAPADVGQSGEVWSADWLAADPAAVSVCFRKGVLIDKPVAAARLYICGLGLYEAYIDGVKAGDEYLMPGYHSYDLTQEYQTLDVTKALSSEGEHDLSVLLGNGWYKGRFVFEGGFENLYGDRMKLIAELHITYQDGSREVIATDDSWRAESTAIGANSIYDGEVLDYRLAGKPIAFTTDRSGKELLHVRTGMPIREREVIKPAAVLHTPAGETVLDFGEMITGWVRFYCREVKDTQVRIQYSELLQEGNFYRDNLRTAKAEFVYVSDGEEKWIRPHFTYYGFRYVKLEGFAQVRPEDFRASRLISEIYETGDLSAGDGTLPDAADPASGSVSQKVNRLIANVHASQRCNFLGVPTDCPQRDERMGWTGDIAAFADTACLNTDCTGFLSHYMELVGREQSRIGGVVPLYVPMPKVPSSGDGLDFMLQMVASPMSLWGDAGVILPWKLYEHRRDKKLLAQQYPVMKAWVDCVKRRVDENEKPHLWQNNLQLGDWLALDSGEETPFGLTDAGFLATACYYYSLGLTAMSAAVIGNAEDEAALLKERESVLKAFQAEFLKEDGTVTIAETQTAYALLLSYQMARPGQEQKAVERLRALVEAKGGHLDTGFLGTAWLCPALSEYGGHKEACRIFLQEDYPGWLHEVNLGAVTTWERWNSLDDNGMVSSTGMNSMNHYAYGSIASWMYRYLCGFTPLPGESRTLAVRPLPCAELGEMKGTYETPWGTYISSWRMLPDARAEYTVTVPFGGKVRLTLPGCEEEFLGAGTYVRTAAAE